MPAAASAPSAASAYTDDDVVAVTVTRLGPGASRIKAMATGGHDVVTERCSLPLNVAFKRR